MTLTEISDLLSDIVATRILDGIYIRATDIDANIDIDAIDLSGKTLVIFNNLPTVSYTVSRSGTIYQSFPIEVKVLQLAKLDDTTAQSDSLRDECTAAANIIFDLVTPDQDLPDSFEYSIDYLGELKVYDKTMTGAKIMFVYNSARSSYAC